MKASTSNGCDSPEASPAFDGGTNGSKAVIMPAQEGQRGSERLSLASLIAGHDLAVDKRGKVRRKSSRSPSCPWRTLPDRTPPC